MFEKFNPMKIEQMAEAQNIETILSSEKRAKRPNMDDFVEIYGPEEISKNKEYLNLIKRYIKEEKEKMSFDDKKVYENNEKRGRVFEIMLADQIHDGGWFSFDAMATRTSEFDDIARGVDLVIEFNEEEVKRLAIAVDASTSSDIKIIEKKIKRNIDSLIKGSEKLNIKYFESQIPDENNNYYKGEIKDLVPVVIALDKSNANKIFDSFSKLISLEKRNDDNAKDERAKLRKELSEHPVQSVFLEEINVQLKMYQPILKDKNIKMFNQVDTLIRVIDGVIDLKAEGGIVYSEELIKDSSLDNIKEISKKYSR